MAGPEDSEDSKSANTLTGGRCLRHKHKQLYSDEGIDDDEIEGKRNFDLQDKLSCFSDTTERFYIELKGTDVTLAYFQKNGFCTPILVKEKSGLGLRIPSENFSVSDVKKCVGSSRVLDVVDVTTQKDLEMSVKEWVQYYENPNRERLLNVISLEFSHTKLENYVDQPAVIHDMDWVDVAWPWYHKELQRESANYLDRMMYPKVQKYCLMSVEGCYTDFHIDMGGTSVWYHILKGKKIFWLIEPTEENLQLYENWTLSAKQGDVFFGDMVDTCHRITLEAGWTFFIPTGWIHAVYTPCDSLVFGGNFLHSFSIPMQLRIWEVETKTHVPPKFRYPFFVEIHWYVLERYVSCLAGKNHRTKSIEELKLAGEEIKDEVKFEQEVKDVDDEDRSTSNVRQRKTTGEASVVLSMICDDGASLFVTEAPYGDDSDECDDVPVQQKSKKEEKNGRKEESIVSETKVDGGNVGEINLRKNSPITSYELEGLEVVIEWLAGLPLNKRAVPKDIPYPDLLLSDSRSLVKYHRNDDQKKAVTGLAIIQWPARKKLKVKEKKLSGGSKPRPSNSSMLGSVWNYRRIRCRSCEPCTRTDCSECNACQDMKKFGGPGTMKKPCVSRQCLQPLLPQHAACLLCSKGPTSKLKDENDLMECTICFEVVHPDCLQAKYDGQLNHSGNVDEDFPSSWECARCCNEGKQGQGRARFRQFTASSKPTTERRRRQNSVISDPLDSPDHSRATVACNSRMEKTNATPTKSPTDVEARVVLKRVRIDSNTPARSRSSSSDASSHGSATSRSPIINAAVSKKKVKVTKSKTVHQSTGSNSTRVNKSSDSEEALVPASPARMNSRGRAIAMPQRYLI